MNGPLLLGHRRNNPSFSSTLLDAIYRSIDNGGEDKVTMKNHLSCMNHEENTTSFPKACTVDKKVAMRRKIYMAEFDAKLRDESMLLKSSSSSSDSSSAGGFSSSESESIYGISNKSKSSCYSMQMPKPKPIRTSLSSTSVRHQKPQMHACDQNSQYHQQHERSNYAPASQKHKRENGFVRTKSKALKIYGDLKRVKQQPISPGGKLASFLNSLFTSGNTKKAKVVSSSSEIKSKTGYESTCSSASSFSRSCLSKTSASSKCSTSTKRSVRFCPVSVTLNEDYRVHKSLHGDDQDMSSKKECMSEELKLHAVEESRRVRGAARALLKKYQMMKDGFDSVESDDDASCASSDLFELDNLSSIGIDHKYRQELPVYETTHLDTNVAIANGFMV